MYDNRTFRVGPAAIPTNLSPPGPRAGGNKGDYIEVVQVILAISIDPCVTALDYSLAMTPLESEALERLGLSNLRSLEQLLIIIFFYGASSSLVVYV